LTRPHLLGANFRLLDEKGKVVWEQIYDLNRLVNQGEALALRDLYRAEAVLTSNFFAGLYNAVVVDTDTPTTLSGAEASGGGYARVPWSRNTTDWGSPTLQSDHSQIVQGATKTFGPGTGGGFGPVTAVVFLTTVDNTGQVWAWFPLQAPITVGAGQTFQVTPFGMVKGVTTPGT
jgi:hypothetical protein